MASLTEIIHITPDLHTGHITEAALDLTHTASQINERMVNFSKTHFSRITHPTTINALMHAKALTPSTKTNWDQREARLGRLLRAAKIIQGPWKVDSNIDNALLRVNFQEPIDILLFLFRAQGRLDKLMDKDFFGKLDTLRFGAYAYVESRILRRAVFEGVYLTKPS